MNLPDERPDRPMHFLVVDDDDDSRATVVEYLTSMGYSQVSQASNGADGLKLVERDPSINFIISDWDMPMMTGLELLQNVRSKPNRSNLPFLMITSPVSKETEKIILAAENLVDEYVIKPFLSRTLEEKIEKMLELSVHGPQKQVVLVDDDNDAREMVKEYLHTIGFKDIKTFPAGKDAKTYVEMNHGKIGMIVSDWEMPGYTGLDLLKYCKSSKVLKTIPFLMITSQSSMERMKVMQAAKASVDEYLLKPFSVDQIKKRVDALLEHTRNRSEVEKLLAEGREHLERGRYKPATAVFDKILELDPKNDLAVRYQGEALFKTKGVEYALPKFKRAIELNPMNANHYLRLSAAYEQLSMHDKAIGLLESAVQNIGFSPDLHFHLGRIYNSRQMADKARRQFKKVLELQPDHTEARLMMEMLAAESGEPLDMDSGDEGTGSGG